MSIPGHFIPVDLELLFGTIPRRSRLPVARGQLELRGHDQAVRRAEEASSPASPRRRMPRRSYQVSSSFDYVIREKESRRLSIE